MTRVRALVRRPRPWQLVAIALATIAGGLGVGVSPAAAHWGEYRSVLQVYSNGTSCTWYQYRFHVHTSSGGSYGPWRTYDWSGSGCPSQY